MNTIQAEERYVICNGIVIGGAYIKRPPAMSNDAEIIQTALLRHSIMNVYRTDNTLRARVARFVRRFLRWLAGSRP